jgi:isopenicillin N synthase-like dioxygenase
MDPAPGGTRDLCRQHRGEAGPIFERPLSGTPHRVINRNGASRHASPFFLGPNHDAVVDCVPTCVGPDNPPHYEPTTYGAFTERLLTLNFEHRRNAAGGEYA